MRVSVFVAFALVFASCEFFAEPDNRPPLISRAELFAQQNDDVFDVTMRVGASDPDGNLDSIDCEGHLSYSGPSPVDTTVSFPLSQSGEDVWSNCLATDTEGAMSDTLLLYTTLPAVE